MFQINSSSLAGKLKSKYGCQNLTINKRGLFQIHGIPYSILFCWRMICSITGLIWSLSRRAIICGIKLPDQMQSCTWSQTANHVLKEVWGNENLKLVKETYETCPSFIVFEHGNLCTCDIVSDKILADISMAEPPLRHNKSFDHWKLCPKCHPAEFGWAEDDQFGVHSIQRLTLFTDTTATLPAAVSSHDLGDFTKVCIRSFSCLLHHLKGLWWQTVVEIFILT